MRFLRAYWTTIRVIASYVFVRFMGRILGRRWFDRALRSAHVRNARRIERAIVALQGLFVKVGQTFSILTNFLPEEFRAELEGLQDSVPPRAFAAIRQRIVDDLGAAPSELFAEFEETPIAAASVSQVHLARLHTGERVAVKVQYPDVDATVRSDLSTFRRILKLVNWFFPAQGIGHVYREVSKMVLAELDFAEEARSITQIGQNLSELEASGVRVPTVYPALSTRHVLTTGFVDGVKVTDAAKLAEWGIDRRQLIDRLVQVYCHQIFVDGLYHADPHPGNILISEDGTMTLLDFGAVATVNAKMRQGIADFLQGVLNQNTERIALALKDMGFIARAQNDEVFDRVVSYFHERFQESITLESFNLEDIKVDPDMGLEHLFALREMDIGLGELTHAFQIPREWILLERTLLLLTGLCTHLDPNARPMDMVRPYLKNFVLGEDGDWSALAVSTGRDVFLQVLGLPGELRKFLSRASSGRLEVKVRGLDDGIERLYALGHQVIFTLIGLGTASIATALHLHGDVAARDSVLMVTYSAVALLLWSFWRRR